MIKIKRYAPEEVGVPDSLIEKLATETESAKEHYAKELEKKKQDSSHEIQSFKFKEYGKTKPDLIKVFNRKCAYCETNILQGQPGDVEHFRPKSAIDARHDGIENLSDQVIKHPNEKNKIKPGYYWLAADWYNLLLSCNSCNRVSTQLNAAKNTGIVIAPGTLKEETLGKGTRFPYIDTTHRIDDTEKLISDEKDIRLLIDPGEDDPALHLTFVKHIGRKTTLIDTGEIETEEKFGMIQALSDKGRASIQVFGLARFPLLQEREKAALNFMSVLTDLKQAVASFLRADRNLTNDPDNTDWKFEKEESKKRYQNKMRSLTAHFINSPNTTAPSEYLGMKRVILRNWIKDENSIIKDLKNMGIDVERMLILDLINEFNFIRSLSKEYIAADQLPDISKKKFYKALMSKVWDAITKEFDAGSEFLESKKSLLSAWINAMTNKDVIVLDTLKSVGIKPEVLTS